ncbi:MAG: hypothetical protein UT86_C0001G0234 [Candidatus Magasanikbacteria bacterium GW2011_GWC2_40_17]|uniref:Uncharacterized protein n=1 Tax=Candidatus Magasanikbacteria bacterium GW2011_GWA2_42_32 TaxID=1619039 RepID=A0A0G1A9G1_9BACT|nr:MAG: hypothetical protein UT86_C0001G0234 [Candidatus Magasanikbacteria bacterium GW2011_GWC2_40_17]KKS57594.1 MAG: hypothetical protein UV20_C0001G0234 [Candidatus Magasanikbacteria bacterium GW2011_GWA2_42_32]
MRPKAFEFLLYRLTLEPIGERDAGPAGGTLRNLEIVRMLHEAASPEHSYTQETSTNRYRWDVRNFKGIIFPSNDREMACFFIARSRTMESGAIVTDTGFRDGETEPDPPLADRAFVVFDLTRHLVAVERRAFVPQSNRWKIAVEDILLQAALQLGYRDTVVLEPQPAQDEILSVFRSFSRLTRLKLSLKLPNPELSNLSRLLFDEMRESRIRDYKQDMHNPAGLSQQEGLIPHASADIAQNGYKKGTVSFEGIRDGRFQKIDAGAEAARGILPLDRDLFVESMRAEEPPGVAETAVDMITAETDRLLPPPGRIQ